MKEKKLISPASPAIEYMGRIDFTDKQAPLFVYAGSLFKTKFTGTSVGMLIQPMLLYAETRIGAVVDGVQYCFPLPKSEVPVYIEIVTGLAEGEHSVTVFKRTAGSHHYFRFLGLMIDCDGEVISPESRYDLKLEVYGDSVSSGEVVEAVYYTAHEDPPHNSQFDNAWFSYSLTTARKLNAEIHCNAQGGISMIDGAGYFNPNNLLGEQTTYNQLSYVPEMGVTEWDFSRYTPDYVIIALGQNDANPNPEKVYDEEFCIRWKAVYKDTLLKIKAEHEKRNPNVRFILLLTVLMHDAKWDTLLDEIAQEINDKNVRRLRFSRCGAATPGHPRIPEQEEMAGELASFIKAWESNG